MNLKKKMHNLNKSSFRWIYKSYQPKVIKEEFLVFHKVKKMEKYKNQNIKLQRYVFKKINNLF